METSNNKYVANIINKYMDHISKTYRAIVKNESSFNLVQSQDFVNQTHKETRAMHLIYNGPSSISECFQKTACRGALRPQK